MADCDALPSKGAIIPADCSDEGARELVGILIWQHNSPHCPRVQQQRGGVGIESLHDATEGLPPSEALLTVRGSIITPHPGSRSWLPGCLPNDIDIILVRHTRFVQIA